MNDQLSTINDLPPEVQRRMFEDRAKAERDEVMRMTSAARRMQVARMDSQRRNCKRVTLHHGPASSSDWPGAIDRALR